MNMKKNGCTTPLLMPQARRLLLFGMVPIYLSLFRLLAEILHRAPFSEATAAYFGGALEYPLAAMVLLGGITLVADRVCREQEK